MVVFLSYLLLDRDVTFRYTQSMTKHGLTLRERLYDRLPDPLPHEDSCWEWPGAKSDKYGYLKYQGKVLRAHRAMYEAHNGTIPDGLKILHSCDNPPCCNPKHLSLGTQQDNVDDMMAKKRHRNGGTGPIADPSPKPPKKISPLKKIRVATIPQPSPIPGPATAPGTPQVVKPPPNFVIEPEPVAAIPAPTGEKLATYPFTNLP